MTIDPDIARLAATRVPRYTSYPPATEFSAATDAEAYRAWLGDLSRDAELSLYLHVPFCEELCFYCGCHTRVVRRAETIAYYAFRLQAEIEAVAACLPGRMPVSHIHWGGGTPTALGSAWLRSVVEVVKRHFRLAGNVEHAIELDPRRLDLPLVQTLAEIGVNRASIGVQTFDPQVQQVIGRVQSYETVATVVEWLRAAGIDAISFDLMYGLPHQTVENVTAGVAQAVTLEPRRVATFGYAHVPWMKKNQTVIGEEMLPAAQERLAQMLALRSALTGAGYEPVGFDHFALPDDPMAEAARSGRLKRNFQGYTTDRTHALIGFGASSIGSLPQGYVQNTTDIRRYQELIGKGQFAVTRGRAVSAEDRARARLIEEILCSGRIDLDGALPIQMQEKLRAEIAPLVEHGLAEIDGPRIAVTDAGWPFVRLLAAAIDAYRDETKLRHSPAI